MGTGRGRGSRAGSGGSDGAGGAGAGTSRPDPRRRGPERGGKGLRAGGCGRRGRAERPGGRAGWELRGCGPAEPDSGVRSLEPGQGCGAVERGSQRLSNEGRPEQSGSTEVRILGVAQGWGMCREWLVWGARMVLTTLCRSQKARGTRWDSPLHPQLPCRVCLGVLC